jgi:hypothetical protein
MFVLPLPYIDMYSQYATTCLILAVKHEVEGGKDGKPGERVLDEKEGGGERRAGATEREEQELPR